MTAETIPRKHWFGFLGMVVGMFMAVLDIQIVASSLQNIQAGLSATTDEIAWIQTAYLIAEVIIIPLSGWLSQALSTRHVFVIACAGFTLMSLGCAFAWDLNAMIGFRFVQGFFGGAMIPVVFATIYTMFPQDKQPLLTVIVGLVVTIAPTLGPILGGYLTELTSWHVLFLINIIPGIFVCASTWFLVDIDKPNLSLFKKMDLPGIIYIAIFLGTLQYVLEEGAKEGWFESNLICALSLISLSCFLLTLYQELYSPDPIVELRALKNRNFAVGCVFSFVIGWGLFSVVFLMPLYLAAVKNLNSFQIGSYVMITGIFQFFSAPLAATASEKMDARLMLAIGLFAYGFGTYLNANLTHESGYWEFFLPQAIRGLSLMFCFLPINNIALGTLPLGEVKNASGLYNLMRNLGGAIGLAITNTYISNATKVHYAALKTHVHSTSLQVNYTLLMLKERLLQTHSFSPNLAAIKLLYLNTIREAMVMTYNDIFFSIALLFFASIVLMPCIRKVKLQ